MAGKIDRALPDLRRQAAETRGRRAETLAALVLRLKGYRVLSRRFKTPSGEIDLIVKRGRTIAFVEVKTRAEAEAAVEAVTRKARRRIARAAALWVAAHPEAAEFDLRFDAVIIARRRLPRHLVAMFDVEGRPW